MPAKASPCQGPRGAGAPLKAKHLNSLCRSCCELRDMGEREEQATRRRCRSGPKDCLARSRRGAQGA